MEVFSPPGNLIGSIQQEYNDYDFILALCGPRENVMLVLRGCQRMFRCKKFQITLPDLLTKVGKIVDVTRWGFTTGYKVTFDKDLGVKRKAIILGACFLIVLICQFLNRQ